MPITAAELCSPFVERDGEMTSVYDLLRQRCGLSQKEAANFHETRIDTVVSWCSGRRRAPQGVIDELLDLNDDIVEAGMELAYLVQLVPQIDDSGNRFIRIGLPSDDEDAIVCGFPTASACEASIAFAITQLKRDIPVNLVPRVPGAIPTAVTQKRGQGRVTVYHFKVWNSQTGDYVVPERKSPLNRIKSIGGEAILETAERIDRKALDHHGRYESTGLAFAIDEKEAGWISLTERKSQHIFKFQIGSNGAIDLSAPELVEPNPAAAHGHEFYRLAAVNEAREYLMRQRQSIVDPRNLGRVPDPEKPKMGIFEDGQRKIAEEAAQRIPLDELRKAELREIMQAVAEDLIGFIGRSPGGEDIDVGFLDNEVTLRGRSTGKKLTITCSGPDIFRLTGDIGAYRNKDFQTQVTEPRRSAKDSGAVIKSDMVRMVIAWVKERRGT